MVPVLHLLFLSNVSEPFIQGLGKLCIFVSLGEEGVKGGGKIPTRAQGPLSALSNLTLESFSFSSYCWGHTSLLINRSLFPTHSVICFPGFGAELISLEKHGDSAKYY